MRGRKPVPTRLKVLAGNPGKRPLNQSEPQPALAFPECPSEVGPTARAEWDRLVPELGELGLLTHFDRAALAVYCGAYALWAEATAAIQKYGAIVKSPSGYPMQSPYIGIANRQAELMIRLASEFGFTPASRSRIVSRQELPLLTLFGSNDEL
jgi:P27 family predicted phage terminase small subunit